MNGWRSNPTWHLRITRTAVYPALGLFLILEAALWARNLWLLLRTLEEVQQDLLPGKWHLWTQVYFAAVLGSFPPYSMTFLSWDANATVRTFVGFLHQYIKWCAFIFFIKINKLINRWVWWDRETTACRLRGMMAAILEAAFCFHNDY